MTRTVEMFDKPRKKREFLMHVIDCGNSNCDGLEQGEQLVALMCKKCSHESGWVTLPNVTIAKKGIPCPVCNLTHNVELTRREAVGVE